MKIFARFKIVLLFFLISLNSYSFSQVDLYLDNLNVYVTEYGRVALYSLPDTIRQVYRTSLLVGTSPDAVFDLILDLDIEEPTTLLTSPTFGDYEIYGSYNNSYSSAPPNVLEKENVYCWQNINAIIIKYTVINREANTINAINGWEFLPRIENSRIGGDTVTYSAQSKIITVKNNKAVGFKVLSEDLKSVGSFYYFTDYENDSLFYSWLSYNSFDSLFITDPNNPTVDAPAIIPALNSKTIASGDSVVFYVALAYDINEAVMLASLEQAQQKYNQLVSVESDLNNIPSDYVLDQNYPNPFNPSTKISFGLPHSSNVVLKVFNALGEEVAELVNESLEAGTHTYNFDASKLTSGIYIYSLQTDAGVISNKMTLLK